jgi:outer membrane autotransporter protein
MIFGRLDDLRSQSKYAKLGYTPVGPAGSTSTSVGYTPVSTGSNPGVVAREPGSWGRVYGSWGDQDDIDNDLGFEYDVVGFMLGYDMYSANNWLFGVNGGYSYTDVDAGVNTDTDIDTISVGFYASYSDGPMYIDSGLMYSNGDIDGDRTIILGAQQVAASSSTDSDTYTAFVEIGYEIPSSKYILTPYVGAMYSKVETDGYTEKAPSQPSAGLVVDDSDDEFYSATLGIKGEYFVDKILHLKGRLSWSHEFSDDIESTTKARFNSAGTSFFSTDGIEVDDDRFGFGVGMRYQYSPQIRFDFDYDLELAEDFDSHTGTVGMKYIF